MKNVNVIKKSTLTALGQGRWLSKADPTNLVGWILLTKNFQTALQNVN